MNSLQKPVLAALFTGLIIVGALVSIPVAGMPVSFAVFFVWLAGLVLGPVWGAASVGLYLVLGLFLPVFSGGTSGPGIFAGFTGGFLVGFLLSVVVIGLLRDQKGSILRNILALFVGVLVCYIPGVLWMDHVLEKLDLMGAVWAMAPYFGFDMVKILLAALAARGILKVTQALSGKAS